MNFLLNPKSCIFINLAFFDFQKIVEARCLLCFRYQKKLEIIFFGVIIHSALELSSSPHTKQGLIRVTIFSTACHKKLRKFIRCLPCRIWRKLRRRNANSTTRPVQLRSRKFVRSVTVREWKSSRARERVRANAASRNRIQI